MQCTACGNENRDGRRFCVACGGGLGLVCPSCGSAAESGERFCGECGAQLGTAADTSASAERAAIDAKSFAAGRYRIQRFLGEGARKRVHLAHDTRLDRDVAIAIIKTDGLDVAGRARINREAQAMGRLGDHPNIVTVYDVGEDEGRPYIVSQYMPGGDVAGILEQAAESRLPIEEAVRIAKDVCLGLEHAHSRRIVHRDLKGANIWLTDDGTAKIGDFGLAVASDRSRLTTEGMMVGTVAYMPPEQALGRTADARSDLYSLGALVYEMVCGRPPFVGDDAVAVISQHINTAPVAPIWQNSAVPKPLDELILELLAKAPDERPQSATEVGETLAAISLVAAAEDEPRLVEEANVLDRLAGGAFVGREEETKKLRRGLDGALSGRGSLFMVSGEPGIGKTRLAEDLGTYAGLRGCQVLTGRCYEGEGAPPYWPWVQIIRSYVHEHDAQLLKSEMGSAAADIAQVVSDVADQLPDLPAPPAMDPAQARFRLFDGITTFLRNASRNQPLVLVLEDLHWADKASLLLLQFLAREAARARILVLGTYRDEDLSPSHALSEVLVELRRERTHERIVLHGLSGAEVRSLLEHTAQHELDRAGLALAEAVHRETDGNPFFIEEILRHLIETGQVYRDHGRWKSDATDVAQLGIPEGIREVVGQRLKCLSDDCNRLLSILSAVGRDFSLEVAQRLSPQTDARVAQLLDEAVAASLLRRGQGRYGFANSLTREILYDEIPTRRRPTLHGEVGEALEHVHRDDVQAHLSELAHHFLEAAPVGDPAKAIDFAVRAGARAAAQLAYEEAAEHYQRALQATELEDEPDELRRCDLALGLGESLWSAGDFDGAREAFRQAGALASALGEPERLARAGLGYGGRFAGFDLGDVDDVLVEMLENALTGLDEADSALKARVLGRLAEALTFSESRDLAVSIAHEAEAMARRVGDQGVLATVLTHRHWSEWAPDNVELRMGMADEIIASASGLGDVATTSQGRIWRLCDLLELGEIEAAKAEFAACEILAKDLRQGYHLWAVEVIRATLALFEGRFAEAEQAMNEALEAGQAKGNLNAFPTYGGQLFALRNERGGIDELVEPLSEFSEGYPRMPVWRCGLAAAHCALGQEEEARREFEALAADDFAVLPRDLFWLTAVAQLAEVCTWLGDTQRAGTLYELLLPFAERNVVISPFVACLRPAHHYLGNLAATRARGDEATTHFEAALALESRMGGNPALAHTKHAYAVMLLARAQPGDRDKAFDLLRDALDTAQELGMKPLLDQILAAKLEAQGAAGLDITTSIDVVASSATADRPDLRPHAAPDGTVTILFSDIEGSTQMNERLGDRLWLDLLHAHNEVIRREVSAHGGFEVKSQGDGFMIAFPSARRALECAIAVQRRLVAEGQLADSAGRSPVRVRMGLHTGEAIREGDDFFGKHVALAARVAAQADGGEILVSSLLKELVDAGGDIHFGEVRERELKGLAGTHRIFPVAWTEDEGRHAVGAVART